MSQLGKTGNVLSIPDTDLPPGHLGYALPHSKCSDRRVCFCPHQVWGPSAVFKLRKVERARQRPWSGRWRREGWHPALLPDSGSVSKER